MRELGFSGDEAAFAGGFEDGGAVALQVGLHAPQRSDARIEARELLFDLRDDRPLILSMRRNGTSRLLKMRACRDNPADVAAMPIA